MADTRFDTGNAVPSDAAKDVDDNVKNLDKAVNTDELTWTDRLGNVRPTVQGRLESMGFDANVEVYTSGIEFLDLTARTKTIDEDGTIYAIKPSAIPFTTTGVWNDDKENFFVVQGVTSDNLSGYTMLSFNTVNDAKSGLLPNGQTVTLSVGDLFSVSDYAVGNDSGILFFRVVPNGTGVDDGGKYIDAGAVQFEQNLKRPYNPKAWGAVGDGVADDYTPIQTCINLLRGWIYIPEGVYLHSKPLVFGAYTRLTGDGSYSRSTDTNPSTVLVKTTESTVDGIDTSVIFDVTGGNVEHAYIEDISFKSESTSPVRYGFYANNETHSDLSVSAFARLSFTSITNPVHVNRGWVTSWRDILCHQGSDVGFFVGGNPATSNHFYGCYVNGGRVGYEVNSIYSSINECAADNQTVCAYRATATTSINSCGAEGQEGAIIEGYGVRGDVVVRDMYILADHDADYVLSRNYHSERNDLTYFTGSVSLENIVIQGTADQVARCKIFEARGNTTNETRCITINNVEGSDFENIYLPLNYSDSAVNATDPYVSIIKGGRVNRTISYNRESANDQQYTTLKCENNSDYSIAGVVPYSMNGTLTENEKRFFNFKFDFTEKGGSLFLNSSTKFNSDLTIKFYKTPDDTDHFYVSIVTGVGNYDFPIQHELNIIRSDVRKVDRFTIDLDPTMVQQTAVTPV